MLLDIRSTCLVTLLTGNGCLEPCIFQVRHFTDVSWPRWSAIPQVSTHRIHLSTLALSIQEASVTAPSAAHTHKITPTHDHTHHSQPQPQPQPPLPPPPSLHASSTAPPSPPPHLHRPPTSPLTHSSPSHLHHRHLKKVRRGGAFTSTCLSRLRPVSQGSHWYLNLSLRFTPLSGSKAEIKHVCLILWFLAVRHWTHLDKQTHTHSHSHSLEHAQTRARTQTHAHTHTLVGFSAFLHTKRSGMRELAMKV